MRIFTEAEEARYKADCANSGIPYVPQRTTLPDVQKTSRQLRHEALVTECAELLLKDANIKEQYWPELTRQILRQEIGWRKTNQMVEFIEQYTSGRNSFMRIPPPKDPVEVPKPLSPQEQRQRELASRQAQVDRMNSVLDDPKKRQLHVELAYRVGVDPSLRRVPDVTPSIPERLTHPSEPAWSPATQRYIKQMRASGIEVSPLSLREYERKQRNGGRP